MYTRGRSILEAAGSARLLLSLVAVGLGAACEGREVTRSPEAPDAATSPTEILAARLDHGLGSGPFDSGLWTDSTNAALLLWAREPVAERELVQADSGMALRVERLVVEGLLMRTGDSVRTTFPVLVGPRAESYYAVAARRARQVLARERGTLLALIDSIEAAGWGDSAYHMIWSQVMDSQTAWTLLIDGELVPAFSPVRSWVVYPGHPHKTGTNYLGPIDGIDYFMSVSWAPQGSSLEAANRSWEGAYRQALAPDAVGAGPTEVATLPVIRPGSALSSTLAMAARRFVEAVYDPSAVAEVAPFFLGDARLAFAALYHDVGWDVLAALAEEGHLEVPAALRRSGQELLGAASLMPVDTAFLRAIGL